MRNLGPELSRRPRGLRVWMTIQMLGMSAFRRHSEHKLELAKWAASTLEGVPNIQIVNTPMLSCFAFRWVPPKGVFCSKAEQNARNADFNRLLNGTGEIFLTPLTTLTGVSGEFCTRMCILGSRTGSTHVQRAIELIELAAKEVTRMFVEREQAGDYHHSLPGTHTVAHSIS